MSVEQVAIERLESRYGPIEDILPLTPLQEGLLFRALYDQQAHHRYGGLARNQLCSTYGAGFLAKRECRVHCCTVGVEASAAHGEIECRGVFGVIVSTVD